MKRKHSPNKASVKKMKLETDLEITYKKTILEAVIVKSRGVKRKHSPNKASVKKMKLETDLEITYKKTILEAETQCQRADYAVEKQLLRFFRVEAELLRSTKLLSFYRREALFV